MHKIYLVNLVVSCLFAGLSSAAGLLAYCYPAAIENSANAAIASLSIIFGLSAAVSSVLVVGSEAIGPTSQDPGLHKKNAKKLLSDDQRTLFRLIALNMSALASIILGIVFLTSVELSETSIWTKLISSAFTFFAAMSLFYSIFLPLLVGTLINRNRSLEGERDRSLSE